ncbi:unnamed protein product [Owenia fusiformis]|uniref:Uncharacterized protein n=1 Tax=Owenia fusiformis TaxID=6347 RepID=A0A8J1UNZ7_OWEFU|nr:unnamed protein product [Owenia fusiformis]
MLKLKVLFAVSTIMTILLVFGFTINSKHYQDITESDIMPKLPNKDKSSHVMNKGGVDQEQTITSLKEKATPLLASHGSRKRRKQLLFSHFPKAGGSEIKTILSRVVGGQIEIHGGREYLSRYRANKTKYFLQNEGQTLTPDLKYFFFVIAHVRSPCNYLLSSWTYGSGGKGDVYNMTKDKSVYGKTPPYNNTDDLDRLTLWLQDNKKIYSKRLIYKYFKTTNWETDLTLKSADCWVHTEMLIYDPMNCLKRYEKQGGYVKWENFRKIKTRRANPSNHSQCKDYFDEKRKALVMNSNKDMAEIFGYETCCTENNATLPAGFEELWTNHN